MTSNSASITTIENQLAGVCSGVRSTELRSSVPVEFTLHGAAEAFPSSLVLDKTSGQVKTVELRFSPVPSSSPRDVEAALEELVARVDPAVPVTVRVETRKGGLYAPHIVMGALSVEEACTYIKQFGRASRQLWVQFAD